MCLNYYMSAASVLHSVFDLAKVQVTHFDWSEVSVQLQGSGLYEIGSTQQT